MSHRVLLDVGISVGVLVEGLELCLHGLTREELRNQVVFVPLR